MRFARGLAFLLLCVTSCAAVRAQTATSATISGRVTDPADALVPGAQVALRSTATNATRNQITNNEGQYVFSAVDPGSYTLTVTKAGFQTETISNVQLDVNKSYTVDVTLQVGSQTQVINVTSGAVAELQTTDATIGNVIGGNDIVSLPTQTRDATELLNLQPTATPLVFANSQDKGIGATGGGVAGAQADQNSISLDGIDVTLNASNLARFTPVFPLNVEAISEFRVGITNPNSTFGIAGGAQESVESRSGTNQFHGVGYWYDQNSAFNANEWENNLLGNPRPQIRDNRVGTAVGGPIQKDKTFFFVNYEVRRYAQSIRDEELVPSQNLRNGIVTFGGQQYNLKDFDPRGIGISPTIQALWKMMPQGNDLSTGDGENAIGYLQFIPATLKDDSVSFRLDHAFGSNLHFFGRYQYSRDLNPAGLGQVDLVPAATTPGTAKFLGDQTNRGDGATTGLDWIIRPNLINSARFGWIRARQADESELGNTIAEQYNLPGTNSAAGPVYLEPGGGGALSAFTLHLNQPIGTGASYTVNSSSYQFRDDVNWTKGSHTVAFGGNVVVLPTYWLNNSQDGVGPADYPIASIVADQNVLFISNPADRPPTLPAAFDGAWDLAYASALGLVDSTTHLLTRDANFNALPPGTPIVQNFLQQTYYFYFQDTWRIRPSLTLSYGIDYGWTKPPTERNGKMMVLVDANGKPIDPTTYLHTVETDALQGQIYNPILYHLPYEKAGMSGYWNTDWKDVGPRISLAWSPSASGGFWGKVVGKGMTVIRGGYGIAYDRSYFPRDADVGAGLSAGLPLSLPLCNDPVAVPGPGCNGSSTDPVVSAFRVGVDGPNIPMQAPGPKPTFPYAGNTNGQPQDAFDYEVDPNFKLGRNHLLDLSIQRQLSNNNIIEVGYVGRLGRNLQNGSSFATGPYMFKDSASGQSFAQAFDAVATAARKGTAIPTEPWFENQLPAGWGASTCGAGFNNTTCIVNNFNPDFIFGNLQDLFGVGGFGGIDAIRLAAGLPSFINTEAADLLMLGSFDKSNYNAMTVSWRNKGWRGLSFDVNYTLSKSMDDGGRPQFWPNSVNDAFDPMVDYGPSYFDRTHTVNATFNYGLPFGTGHALSSHSVLVNRAVGGWYLSGIFTGSSGLPQIAAESFAYGGGNVSVNPIAEIPTVNPNSLGSGVHTGVSGTPCNGSIWGPRPGTTAVDLFADPGKVACSFRPVLLSSDTRDGRDSPFRGFPNWNLDLRLGKQTSITERVKAEISADFFNVFNHVVFNDPGGSASQGGLDLTNPGNFGVTSSQAIPGNRIAGSRWVEMGLRVSF